MTLVESPSMLKVSDAWQKWDGTSKVCMCACHVWCDHPRQLYISRLTVYRWCGGWGSCLLNPCHWCVIPGLLLVGTDGMQVVSMQGLAAPLLIPWAYHMDWYIGIGPLFHHILLVFASVLYFMVALEGSDMDQDHAPYLQGCCPATLVVIELMALCLFGLKWFGLLMDPLDMFP